jgi:hypothetical protein
MRLRDSVTVEQAVSAAVDEAENQVTSSGSYTDRLAITLSGSL